MGWAPDGVRAATLRDFSAAFEGWQMANGIDPGPDVSDGAVQRLEELMERYPDERRTTP